MLKHRLLVLVGYNVFQPCSHPESRLASASFDPASRHFYFYSLARVKATVRHLQLNRYCVGHATTPGRHLLVPTYFYLLLHQHPLGSNCYLHLSLHSHQPHSSHHITHDTHNTTATHNSTTTNKQINLTPQQHTANMQFTNYALTLLLPALAAAQGGAESVGNDIGNGLGAVSLPQYLITNTRT